ncbi:MAG: hypothetical protein ISQ80_03360, partial [Candidatus Actinomarina sp.]|nr:hypothetical protein [Candidatus Actinomarina sp.]
LKSIFVVVLIVNIVIGLLIYFLNINLFSILQIENYPLQIEEPRYKLNTSSSNLDSDLYNEIYFLYDSDCKKYGPFEFEETFQEIQNGLFAYCQKEILDENVVLINLHERREAGKPSIKSNITNLIYSFPGFEGDEETNTRIELAVNQLPAPLREILNSEIQVLNGCHPYAEALFNRCVYGVFDPVGYGADGNYGNEWKMTIWISDRGIESGRLKDILTHEAAHAYSYLVLRECVVSDGSSYRELAHERFGNDENLADVFVLYYGGKWTNYYKRDNISISDRKWMQNMIDYCEFYQEALTSLSS